MGHTAASSKRKSSNKKTSKISSQVSRKKKIRRNKSKKRRGGDDSDSDSYSDDGSTSSMSVSYSSSEDEYKSRKGRSRVRSSVKSKKRIVQRRSSSREGSKDSTRLRKRKRLKKNGDSKLRKKSKKKRPKRHDSIRSKSSDSTDRGGSNSSGEESDFERLRRRSRDKKVKGDSGKRKSGIKKSKHRSRSGENRDSHDTENVVGEINTRRLRSVITVTKEPSEREEDERDKDEHTEEIVYDHDDYPSCRSNDSNDGGNKRELVDQSHVEFEKRRRVENVTQEEAFVLSLATNESVVSVEDDNDPYDGLIPYPDRFRTNSPEKEHENEASQAPTVAGSGHDGDDMELILRQKALENLKRFRGRLETNPKTHGDVENKSDVSVKQVFSANAECVQSKSPKKDPEIPMLRSDSFRPTRAGGKIPVGRFSGTESGAVEQSVVHPPDKVIPSRRLKDKDLAAPHALSNKSESNRSTMRHESLGTVSTPKQAPMPLASPRAAVPVTKSILNKSVAETSQTAAVIRSDNNSIGVLDASKTAAAEPPSSVKPTSEEHDSSRERQDEAKDSSQFEQKTMTVMRGGELVQVNYKVYIPKKAPALARRKLQR